MVEIKDINVSKVYWEISEDIERGVYYGFKALERKLNKIRDKIYISTAVCNSSLYLTYWEVQLLIDNDYVKDYTKDCRGNGIEDYYYE
jgi:hypothetical protein